MLASLDGSSTTLSSFVPFQFRPCSMSLVLLCHSKEKRSKQIISHDVNNNKPAAEIQS